MLRVTNNQIADKIDAEDGRLAAMDEKIDRVLGMTEALTTKMETIEADVAKTKDIVEAWAAIKTTGKFVKWAGGISGALVAIWLFAKSVMAHVIVGVVK